MRLPRGQARLACFLLGSCIALAAAETNPLPEPRVFVSQHALRIGSGSFNYRAEALETYLHDKEGSPTATLFPLAYFKNDVENLDHRPLAFVFNDDGAPPYELADNPRSIRLTADLTDFISAGGGLS